MILEEVCDPGSYFLF